MPELRIYPFARFFDLKATESATETHTSWLFVALSFHIPRHAALEASGGALHGHNVDLTHVIQEFAFVVDQWEQRHGGMDLQVDHLRRDQVPSWVVESTDGRDVSVQQQSEPLTHKRRSSGPDDPKCFSDDETPHAQQHATAAKKRSKRSGAVESAR